jgi:aryl-alcohol dehydrogenase-like predicted oxidoreductase
MLGVGGNPNEDFLPYITTENFQVVSGYLKMDACNLCAFEKEIRYFRQQKVAYYAAAALHMALLGNRFEAYTSHPPNTEWITAQDVLTAQAVNAVAQKYELPLSTLAQRYLFSIKEADRVVMGARKLNEIKSTISDWQQGVLPEPIFDEVTKIILETRSNQHTQ